MPTHEAREDSFCSACRATAPIVYRAHATFDGIRCSFSISCACGHTVDGENWRDEVRDLFRETAGMWALRVTSLGPDRAAALRVLKVITGAAPAALLAFVRDGTSVAEGSPLELDRVELLLLATGATVERVRIEAEPAP